MPSFLGTVASQRSVVAAIPTAGLAGWYDADNAASFDVTTGSIATWRDRSPNGYTATSPAGYANAAYRPVRTTAGINGRYTANWPDINRVLESQMPANTKPFSVFAALSAGATVSSDRSYLGVGAPGTMGPDFRFEQDRPQIMVPGYDRLAWSVNPLPADTPSVLSWTYANGGAWANFVNGVANGTGTYDIAFTAGRISQIGSNNNYGGSGFLGHIGEIIKYNRVLSTVERQQVEAYLKTKWGTP